MIRHIFVTEDGSHSVSVDDGRITYHSRKGALAESIYVFLQEGLHRFSAMHVDRDNIRVFEMGFGTGLNAFITGVAAASLKRNVIYHGIEKYPLTKDETKRLNYTRFLGNPTLLAGILSAEWEKETRVSDFYTIKKMKADLLEFQTDEKFDIIFFDAFGPADVPSQWTIKVFEKLYSFLEYDGMLVTYCSKTEVRNTLKAAGFDVKKIPGPIGKREMVVAFKKRGWIDSLFSPKQK